LGRQEIQERSLKNKDETKTALNEAKKEMNSKINKMSEVQKRKFIDNG
jgi:hypothetical protein